ncbi:hypothetical protein GUJ93_ZPchr0013g35729 [Zizania palustris]|uniref:CSC1-like protein n=1 Tax=Zizania palustris TaxID=103762 RepID=A0A8J6C079_ZIZPA|nr:hypothetical protein GUJ93_ZPchr0013g35729 [Zizania palustris]
MGKWSGFPIGRARGWIFSALLTSAGINIAFCALFLSLYSVLRKQPHNFGVYFGRRLAEEKFRQQVDYFSFERLLPTAGWIVKAYWCTEEEIRRVAGLDSVVFLRLFIFSIRIFSITSLVCIFGVLPEYKYISRKRLAHITGSTPNPAHFSVLVRSIPKSDNELLDDTIRNFFVNYHGSSYLSHKMIYRKGNMQKFVLYRNKFIDKKKSDLSDPDVIEAQKVFSYLISLPFDLTTITLDQQLSSSLPKVLLFNLLGFTFSILAPLILPFLLVYFCLGYLVYRNQILNVYYPKYEMGGKLWPVMHNGLVFALVLTQIIALGVFTIKHSPVATGFTILLLIGTILFNEYCRHRFARIFDSFSAQDLIELDRDDEQSGRMEEIHQHLLDAYSQASNINGSKSSKNGEGPIEMVLDDPAQEASDSNQELIDTVKK